MSEIPSEYRIAYFRCPQGHIVGIVDRMRHNGTRITVLKVLRRSADEKEMPLPVKAIDISAEIIGYAPAVVCGICGAERPWVPGEESMRALMDQATPAVNLHFC